MTLNLYIDVSIVTEANKLMKYILLIVWFENLIKKYIMKSGYTHKSVYVSMVITSLYTVLNGTQFHMIEITVTRECGKCDPWIAIVKELNFKIALTPTPLHTDEKPLNVTRVDFRFPTATV